MTSCKVDWGTMNPKLQKKLKDSAPDKNNEDFLFYPELNSYAVQERNDFIRSIGCHECLLGEKGQDEYGNITLGKYSLLNYRELILNNVLQVKDIDCLEISNNVWICPNCYRIILDFIPKFDILPVESLECQPLN